MVALLLFVPVRCVASFSSTCKPHQAKVYMKFWGYTCVNACEEGVEEYNENGTSWSTGYSRADGVSGGACQRIYE